MTLLPSEVTIAFVGDTHFGEGHQEKRGLRGEVNFLQQEGYDYSLAAVRSFLLESSLVIANLETPLTYNRHAALEGIKPVVHRGDPVISPRTLREHNITAVTLANNHGMDHGADGLVETLAALDEAGIAAFGAGMDRTEASVPYVRQITDGLELIVIGAYMTSRPYSEKYGFYAGSHKAGVRKLKIDDLVEQISTLRQKHPSALIIVFPHWAIDYQWRSQKLQNNGHAMIDAGADLIIGHGAHMLNEVEVYNGAWIVYSLGNFMFSERTLHRENAMPPYSLVARLHFRGRTGSLRLYPLYSDNEFTRFQPRFVDQSDFPNLMSVLTSICDPDSLSVMVTSADSHGPFIELPLQMP